jgi:hypothetical protein
MQEQVFLDQAMRVPKLMVALELGGKDDHDISTEDVPFLPDVRGPRGDLAVFSGVRRQPDDDLRLIATPGFVNLPSGSRNLVRVPMVFEYRGEIVPSFPLEAILLWLRATPAEVKVELGSQITLPNGWKIPLNRDGTATINPAAWSSVRRLGLDDLLLAAHEREHHPQTHDFSLKDQIVVLRLAGDPLQQSTAFPAAIATIQDGAYVHAAPTTVEWLFILLAALLACLYRMISRADFFFGAVLFTAAYGLLELGLLSQHRLWLPMLMPLALVWFLFVVRVFDREGLIKHEIVATA